jgi:diguanylate cyclase (GGDEF)-like protein
VGFTGFSTRTTNRAVMFVAEPLEQPALDVAEVIVGTRRMGVYLATLGTVAAGSFLVPGPAGAVVRLSVAAAGIGVLVQAILVQRPNRRAGWYLIALSGCLTYGEAVLIAAKYGLGAGERVGTVTQLVVAILALVALAGGLAVLGWRTPGTGRLDTLDVAIIATSAFLLVWVFYVNPALARGASDFGTTVAIVIPAGSLLVFAMVVKLALGGALSTWSGRLLLLAASAGLGIAALLILPIGAPDVPINEPILGAWLAHMILLGAAGIAPGFEGVVCEVRQPAGVVLSLGRVVVFVLLALIAPLNVAVGFARAGTSGPSLAAIIVPPLCGTLILLILVIRLALVARVARTRAEELGERSASLARAIAERGDLERALTHRATHDTLTGLANRDVLTERLDRRRAAYRGPEAVEGRGQALMMVDLDGFKGVNDSLGHPAGDQVLIDVAQRLVDCVGERAVVGRLGGDEFAVLLENTAPDEARRVAEAIRQTVQAPFVIAGHEMFLTASIGLLVTEPGGRPPGPSEGLRDADQAMYEAKQDRNRVVEFRPNPLAQRAYQVSLSNGLRSAIGRGELFLQYQPIVALDDQRIVAVEALVRWRPEGRDVLSPSQFLPVAEETGLITEIGAWILRRACGDARPWHARHDTAVAVNVSGRQLNDANFADNVLETLATMDVPGVALILEVAESTVTETTTDPALLAQLDRLRANGVKIAINDFVVGRSPPSDIARLPVDLVKIDSAIARGPAGSPAPRRQSAPIRETLAGICDAKLAAVAVGIESREQAEMLLQLNCPYGQGFYFSPPLPADRIGRLLHGRADRLHRRELPQLDA